MKFSEFLSEAKEVNVEAIAKDSEWSDNVFGDVNLSSWEPKITSLKGCPSTVTGMFDCSNNKLKNLVGGPKRVNDDYIANENKLTNLEGIAEYIGGRLSLSFMPSLKSLKDIHKHVKHIGNNMVLIENEIKSNVLGLLLIPGLTFVQGSVYSPSGQTRYGDAQWIKIVNTYLPNHRGNDAVMECQTELIDAGLDEYAQL